MKAVVALAAAYVIGLAMAAVVLFVLLDVRTRQFTILAEQKAARIELSSGYEPAAREIGRLRLRMNKQEEHLNDLIVKMLDPSQSPWRDENSAIVRSVVAAELIPRLDDIRAKLKERACGG
jgi:hypothetical protein